MKPRIRRGALRFVFALTLFLTTVAHADLIVLNRQKFEAGVDYDVIGKLNSPCYIDNLGVQIDWGDRNVQPLTFVQSLPFPNPPGSWDIRPLKPHVYVRPGNNYSRAWTLLKLHCSNATVTDGPWVPQRYQAQVYPRRSLTSLSRNTEYPTVSGSPVELRAIIDGPAYPSDARIFLKCLTGCALIDPAAPLNAFVDISAGQNEAKVKYQIVARVPAPTRMSVQASAANKMTVSFTVTP